jgi:CHAT domain-containing protein
LGPLPSAREEVNSIVARFARHLKAGTSNVEALRQAKLEMVRSEIPADRFPYYWAPFVLEGK